MESENDDKEPEFAYKISLEDGQKEIITPNICVDEKGRRFIYELVMDGGIKHYTDIDKLLAYIKRNINITPYCSVRIFYPGDNCVKFTIKRQVRKEATKEDFRY